LLELNTQVDFNDFDCMVCYCRGDTYKVTEVRIQEAQQTVDVFEQVVLLLRFKDSAILLIKGQTETLLGLSPENLCLPLKNIPNSTSIYISQRQNQYDLERRLFGDSDDGITRFRLW